MRVPEVIVSADMLCPNNYSRSEKLDWCYELTCMICATHKKQYGVIEYKRERSDGAGTDKSTGLLLPPHILLEDVARVEVDGRAYDKVDERSFREICEGGGDVRVVYKLRPEPYIEYVYEGEYECEGNSVTVVGARFAAEDLLRITADGEVSEAYVLVRDGFTFTLSTELGDGVRHLRIERVAAMDTPVPPPFDAMYVDYVLGKVAFYQNDLNEYNKHMTAFNAKLREYGLWYKQTNPLVVGKSFKNKW